MERLSNRKIAKRLGIDRETVARILSEGQYNNYYSESRKNKIIRIKIL